MAINEEYLDRQSSGGKKQSMPVEIATEVLGNAAYSSPLAARDPLNPYHTYRDLGFVMAATTVSLISVAIQQQNAKKDAQKVWENKEKAESYIANNYNSLSKYIEEEKIDAYKKHDGINDEQNRREFENEVNRKCKEYKIAAQKSYETMCALEKAQDNNQKSYEANVRRIDRELNESLQRATSDRQRDYYKEQAETSLRIAKSNYDQRYEATEKQLTFWREDSVQKKKSYEELSVFSSHLAQTHIDEKHYETRRDSSGNSYHPIQEHNFLSFDNSKIRELSRENARIIDAHHTAVTCSKNKWEAMAAMERVIAGNKRESNTTLSALHKQAQELVKNGREFESTRQSMSSLTERQRSQQEKFLIETKYSQLLKEHYDTTCNALITKSKDQITEAKCQELKALDTRINSVATILRENANKGNPRAAEAVKELNKIQEAKGNPFARLDHKDLVAINKLIADNPKLGKEFAKAKHQAYLKSEERAANIAERIVGKFSISDRLKRRTIQAEKQLMGGQTVAGAVRQIKGKVNQTKRQVNRIKKAVKLQGKMYTVPAKGVAKLIRFVGSKNQRLGNVIKSYDLKKAQLKNSINKIKEKKNELIRNSKAKVKKSIGNVKDKIKRRQNIIKSRRVTNKANRLAALKKKNPKKFAKKMDKKGKLRAKLKGNLNRFKDKFNRLKQSFSLKAKIKEKIKRKIADFIRKIVSKLLPFLPQILMAFMVIIIVSLLLTMIDMLMSYDGNGAENIYDDTQAGYQYKTLRILEDAFYLAPFEFVGGSFSDIAEKYGFGSSDALVAGNVAIDRSSGNPYFVTYVGGWEATSSSTKILDTAYSRVDYATEARGGSLRYGSADDFIATCIAYRLVYPDQPTDTDEGKLAFEHKLNDVSWELKEEIATSTTLTANQKTGAVIMYPLTDTRIAAAMEQVVFLDGNYNESIKRSNLKDILCLTSCVFNDAGVTPDSAKTSVEGEDADADDLAIDAEPISVGLDEGFTSIATAFFTDDEGHIKSDLVTFLGQNGEDVENTHWWDLFARWWMTGIGSFFADTFGGGLDTKPDAWEDVDTYNLTFAQVVYATAAFNATHQIYLDYNTSIDKDSTESNTYYYIFNQCADSGTLFDANAENNAANVFHDPSVDPNFYCGCEMVEVHRKTASVTQEFHVTSSVLNSTDASATPYIKNFYVYRKMTSEKMFPITIELSTPEAIYVNVNNDADISGDTTTLMAYSNTVVLDDNGKAIHSVVIADSSSPDGYRYIPYSEYSAGGYTKYSNEEAGVYYATNGAYTDYSLVTFDDSMTTYSKKNTDEVNDIDKYKKSTYMYDYPGIMGVTDAETRFKELQGDYKFSTNYGRPGQKYYPLFPLKPRDATQPGLEYETYGGERLGAGGASYSHSLCKESGPYFTTHRRPAMVIDITNDGDGDYWRVQEQGYYYPNRASFSHVFAAFTAAVSLDVTRITNSTTDSSSVDFNIREDADHNTVILGDDEDLTGAYQIVLWENGSLPVMNDVYVQRWEAFNAWTDVASMLLTDNLKFGEGNTEPSYGAGWVLPDYVYSDCDDPDCDPGECTHKCDGIHDGSTPCPDGVTYGVDNTDIHYEHSHGTNRSKSTVSITSSAQIGNRDAKYHFCTGHPAAIITLQTFSIGDCFSNEDGTMQTFFNVIERSTNCRLIETLFSGTFAIYWDDEDFEELYGDEMRYYIESYATLSDEADATSRNIVNAAIGKDMIGQDWWQTLVNPDDPNTPTHWTPNAQMFVAEKWGLDFEKEFGFEASGSWSIFNILWNKDAVKKDDTAKDNMSPVMKAVNASVEVTDILKAIAPTDDIHAINGIPRQTRNYILQFIGDRYTMTEYSKQFDPGGEFSEDNIALEDKVVPEEIAGVDPYEHVINLNVTRYSIIDNALRYVGMIPYAEHPEDFSVDFENYLFRMPDENGRYITVAKRTNKAQDASMGEEDEESDIDLTELERYQRSSGIPLQPICMNSWQFVRWIYAIDGLGAIRCNGGTNVATSSMTPGDIVADRSGWGNDESPSYMIYIGKTYSQEQHKDLYMFVQNSVTAYDFETDKLVQTIAGAYDMTYSTEALDMLKDIYCQEGYPHLAYYTAYELNYMGTKQARTFIDETYYLPYKYTREDQNGKDTIAPMLSWQPNGMGKVGWNTSQLNIMREGNDLWDGYQPTCGDTYTGKINYFYNINEVTKPFGMTWEEDESYH